MKRYILVAISFILSSCGLDNSYYFMRNFEKDQVLTTNIGDPMTSSKLEYRNNVYHNVLSSEQTELIYSGKSGNVIKLVYREYSNNLARPAFAQELQYDLSEGMTIKFKSDVMEIIKATNQEITFKVLQSRLLKLKQGKLSETEVTSSHGSQTGSNQNNNSGYATDSNDSEFVMNLFNSPRSATIVTKNQGSQDVQVLGENKLYYKIKYSEDKIEKVKKDTVVSFHYNY